MFKTTVTAWLVRLMITWVGAGVIAFLVADYVLRVNVETVGVGMDGVVAGIERLEAGAAERAGEIAALRALVEAQDARLEALAQAPAATPEGGAAGGATTGNAVDATGNAEAQPAGAGEGDPQAPAETGAADGG